MPAVLFSMLSIFAYVAALRSNERFLRMLFWSAMAGVLLRLAFLSKYFDALLGFAYLVHILFIRRDAGRLAVFVLLLLAALFALIYNLCWNSSHCWINILFNFMNRQGKADVSWINSVLCIVSLLYLATPWFLFELWRQRRYVSDAVRRYSDTSAAFWLMLILLLFALMAIVRLVGLPWLLSFVLLLPVLGAIAILQNLLGDW